MDDNELFPDIAKEAARNKKHKARARVVAAQMRLDERGTDMQDFVLRVFREHGYGDLHWHVEELKELCGADFGTEEFEQAFLLLLRTVFDMAKVGILWQQDWPECGEGVSTWGIRGVHNKKDMLRKAREAKA